MHILTEAGSRKINVERSVGKYFLSRDCIVFFQGVILEKSIYHRKRNASFMKKEGRIMKNILPSGKSVLQ